MHILRKEIKFPPVEDADDDGFLAVGGDLSSERLLEAYRHGIFPWYSESEPICWWSPDPRCVLYPHQLHVSKSMQQLIRRKIFSFTVDKAFTRVMKCCQTIKRNYGDGSWIQDEMIAAYTELHKSGHAHSAEAWFEGNLVGGLYGIKIGKVFFGESMFSTVANASKFTFIKYIQQLQGEGLQLVDCQQQTNHLVSLGAEMISRKSFIDQLNIYCTQ